MLFLLLYMDILFVFGIFGIFIFTPFANAIFFSYGITFHFLSLEFLFWYLFTTTFFSLLRFFFPVSFHYVSLYRYNSFFGILSLRCFIFFIAAFLFFFPFIFRYSCTAFFHYWNYFLSYLLEFIFLWNRKESSLSLTLFLSLSRLKISHKIHFVSRSHSPYVKIFPQFY